MSNNKSVKLFGLVLFAITLSFALLANPAIGKELAEKQVLHTRLESADIGSMDPQFATTSVGFAVVRDIFNGLVRFKPGDVTTYKPDLAKDWEVSEDGTVWTFYLRKDVKWQKGYGKFTAEDVNFSINRLQDPEVGSSYASEYSNIKKVEIINDYEVKFHLKKPDGFFLSKVANFQGGYIVCKKAVKELGEKYKSHPVGTGPFVLKEYVPKDKIVLVRNEHYFRDEPTLTKIIYRFIPTVSSAEAAMKAGELDTFGQGSQTQEFTERMRKNGFKVDAVGLPSTTVLYFNMTMEPLNKFKVRKAIAYALNRKVFVEYLGSAIAKPEYAPVPDSQFAGITNVRKYKYNPEWAKKLLDEAGYPNGFTLKNVLISSRADYRPWLEMVQAQLKKVGIDIGITPVEHSTYHARIRKDVNPLTIYACSRFPGAPKRLSQFYSSAAIVSKPTGVTNFSHYGQVDADGDFVVDSVDNLLDQASSVADKKVQKRLYAKAQKKIMGDLPSYPLVAKDIILVRQPWVDLGYKIQSTAIYHYNTHEYMKLYKH